MNISFYRLYKDVEMPTRGTKWSIGIDLKAYIKSSEGRSLKTVIPPQTTRVISTGLVAILQGLDTAMFVCSRSGMATKGLFVANAPGVIDPDYRGELKVILHNGSTENQWVSDGDRIAQIVVLPAILPEICETAFDLRTLETERGDKGFGSTGA